MQKILAIVLGIAVIFTSLLWQIDIACANDDGVDKYHKYRKCDLSGLWIMEPDSETGFHATSFFIPLDPFKKRYAVPTKFIVPPPPIIGGETIIPAGGIAKRISRCTFIADGFWYGVSADGEKLYDIVIYGTWHLEDKNTAVLTSTFKTSLPDGTVIFCGEETETIFHRLVTEPPSEWDCPWE